MLGLYIIESSVTIRPYTQDEWKVLKKMTLVTGPESFRCYYRRDQRLNDGYYVQNHHAESIVHFQQLV